MKHVAFFGDGEHTFALTMPMIIELERKAGVGIGALYQRLMSAQFFLADLVEVIRLGLIGAGTSPADAQSLIDAYVPEQPILPLAMLAMDIIEARWSGTAIPVEAPQDELRQAAATGDLSAAIRAAYQDTSHD